MNITVQGVSITLTPEQLQQIDAEVKKINKPISEERFKQLITGIDINRPTIDFEKYPYSIFWLDKDGNYFFEYDFKKDNCWCSWEKIWRVFETEFRMKYEEIQAFIKIQVEQQFKLNGVTPGGCLHLQYWEVEQHFKLNGVTPAYAIVEDHSKSLNK
jgi:hypothetical protein